MSAPTQGSVFPTFLQYWKNLIQPSRRTIPIARPKTQSKKSKRKAVTSVDCLEGNLILSGSGSYSVDGKDFAIDACTIVFGELRIGSSAKVTCTVDGTKRRATKIMIG